MKRILMTVLTAMLVLAAVALPATAARPAASLEVVPATAVASATGSEALTILGEGFARKATVAIAITGERSKGTTTDGTGSFSLSWEPAPGTYELTAYQLKGGRGWELAAALKVVVD